MPPTILLLLCLVPLRAQAPAGYVAPGLCANCHAAIAERYRSTPMARSFGTVRQPPPPGAFRHHASEQLFTLFNRGGQPMLRRQQIGFDGAPSNVLERKLDYWFGSGNHARSFVSRNATGDLIELPLTWYAENGGHWGMSPAYDVAQHAGFSRKITYRCMSCHNAYPALPPGADQWENATRWPAQLPEGIDCQRCHGPGQSHVDAVRLRKPAVAVRAAIVNPAKLDPVRKMEVCLQCHLETTNAPLPNSLIRRGRGVFSYRPGEPLEDYALYFDHAPGTGQADKFEFASAPYRLRQSRCFLESRGALTCTTCHDPHGPQAGTSPVARYAAMCRSCHPGAAESHVTKPPDDCVSCHMPRRRPSDAIHDTVADHLIQRKAGARAEDPLEEKAAPPYRGRVALYYPEVMADAAASELYRAVAQVVHQANLTEGMALLEAAIAKWKPTQAQFYADLAGAYRQTGQPGRAADWYRQALRLDPQNWPAYFGLGVIERAPDALRRAMALAPWNTEIVKSLASVLPSPEAFTLLRSATAADPDSGDLQNNLGTALLRLGDFSGAGRALREAVRLRPEVPSIRINLATLLARQNHWLPAKHEFEQALRLDNSSAEGHSAYGVALAARGNLASDLVAARQQLETALTWNPALWNTRNNLGTLLERMGDPAAAIREYRAALAIRDDFPAAHYNLAVLLTTHPAEAEQHFLAALRGAPDHDEAHLKWGQLLCAQQRCEAGVVHLRQAAKSANPPVRNAAEAALRGAR